MIISWSQKARETASNILNFIFTEFGSKASQKYLQNIERTTKVLESNPYAGRIEPLLIGSNNEYRSLLVNKINKLVYRIDHETIVIVALWDTRREPKKLTEGLK
ncbi:MAG: type II toxin-antitoxin system RelE/ParE family toxin [Bacteroidales bacterium]|nr:type II toxin-antitoxin system RelE/ParE family toxin [Bacteroidales bacterium]